MELIRLHCIIMSAQTFVLYSSRLFRPFYPRIFVMLKFFNLLIGSAGLEAIAVGATPATAQSMPYSGYSQGGGIGAVIGSLLGGDRIGTYDRDTNQVGVEQCARAAEAQVSRAYSSDRY